MHETAPQDVYNFRTLEQTGKYVPFILEPQSIFVLQGKNEDKKKPMKKNE